jgi:hypothetical protein
MAYQINHLFYLGGLIFLIAVLQGCLTKKSRAFAGAAIAAMLLFWPAFRMSPIKESCEHVLRIASSLPTQIQWLYKDPREYQDLYQRYFSAEAFSVPGSAAEPAYEFLKSELAAGRLKNFYVFGDDSIFYILLDQIPPYYLTHYNASGFWAQEVLVEWLKIKKPNYILSKAEDVDFDGVPAEIRSPLLYKNDPRDSMLHQRNFGAYRVHF